MPRPLPLAVLCTGIAACLTGCTAFTGYTAPVIVTVTPTVTITPSASASPAPSSPSPSAGRTDIPSDDVGKAHDLGKIVAVKVDGGTKVIGFDRFLRSGVRSSTMWRDGVQLAPHTDELFTGGSNATYLVPVRPDATFVKQTCTTPDQPAQSTPSTLDELKGLSGRAAIVQLDLDNRGWVQKVTSDPVCL